MALHKKYPINLKKSKIAIVIAQITGPLPNGKHQTVINERETLAWKSLDDMKFRINKACSILDELANIPLKPDIVVFPEYSLPVLKALGDLQRKVDEHGFVLIGAADNIEQANSTEIYNRSPILLPQRKQPIWITKRIVSQWEQGLVDSPLKPSEPLLTWEVSGRKHWISTHICLDFSLAPEEFKHGGGLFIVTMCSPDMMSFLGWADGLLRLDGGSATVLCNCVGGDFRGQSGVVAVNAGGKPFQAAFELSTTEEEVCVFEIDCSQLSPPKKSSLKPLYPLGRRYVYAITNDSKGIKLKAQAKPLDVRKRGVINPAIFDVLGKKMRVAFLNVPQYAEVEEKVNGKDYEVLAILGKEDLMVTHVSADAYDMIFDVAQSITWIDPEGKRPNETDLEFSEDDLPHFRIDAYYKVLGVPVSDADRAIFKLKDKPFPSPEEITKVFKLGQKWEDSDVSDEERTRFTLNRWILDITETVPGEINAVMTISILHARNENKHYLLKKFEADVIPKLMGDSQVTSLYRGVSHRTGIDYVLRLSLNLEDKFKSLYDLIADVHKLSKAARLIVDSTTYIVVKSLATISLAKAALVVNLPPELKLFRDRRICPYLSADDRVRLIFQPEQEQSDFINQFRPLDDALEKVNYFDREADSRLVLLQNLARGLFKHDFELLKEVHDPLLTWVERRLGEFVKNSISDTEFEALKASSSSGDKNIQSQKTKKQLSYTERINAVLIYIETTGKYQDLLPAILALKGTTLVRNAFAHAEWERISIKDCLHALIDYCRFVSTWKFLFRPEHDIDTAVNDSFDSRD